MVGGSPARHANAARSGCGASSGDAPGPRLKVLKRVADRVVIVACSSLVLNKPWLPSDYFPAMARLSHRAEIGPEQVAETLGGNARIQVLPDLARLAVDGEGPRVLAALVGT